MIAWSYGGGWQSVAIGVLIREGALSKPDLAGIVDTGREKQTTWDYLHNVMQPYLDPIGVKIEVVPHSLSRKDLYDDNGLTLMPAYTTEGRLASFCSGEWKRDVMERWLRSRGVKQCTQWIGFSIDEIRRVPEKDHRNWCQLDFPLINLFVNRAMCRTLIEKAGLPMPKKSRCYMCPHQTDEEWQEVRDDIEDWEKAVAVDREIRERDPEQAGLFLWSGRKPLELADLGTGILTPSRPCENAHCFT